jgi:hypothetical protein
MRNVLTRDIESLRRIRIHVKVFRLVSGVGEVSCICLRVRRPERWAPHYQLGHATDSSSPTGTLRV